MQIYSMFENSVGYKLTEVEVTLLPGLPDLKIMGLPDQSVKESALRIKSAVKQQGFRFPDRQQVLVNLHPSSEKKSGRGLELAIAVAFLVKSEQMQLSDRGSRLFVYGELTMEGHVRSCPEVEWAKELLPGVSVLTGAGVQPQTSCLIAKDLQSLSEATFYECSEQAVTACRPDFSELQTRFWSKDVARKMAVIACGGHHSLLAGPAGSGKSTVAEAIHAVLPDLTGDEASDLRSWNLYFQRPLNDWRPLCRPHHTLSLQGLTGGGNPVVAGDLTRAHLGILLLDEFLEFPSHAREALREPLERGQVQLSRTGTSENLPARFQLLATTNLCPCGDFVPESLRTTRCRFSIRKCRAYLERLTGPLVDRFDVLMFMDSSSQVMGDCTLSEVFRRVQVGVEFARLRGKVANGRLGLAELFDSGIPKKFMELLPSGTSARRQLSVLRVARTLADLEQSEAVEIRHVREAIELAWAPFEKLSAPFC